MSKAKFCLLIGNTRWHWAIEKQDGWFFIHTPPDISKFNEIKNNLWRWAAVGPIPLDIRLDQSKSISLEDIPLKNLPSWLGIDRALGSWAALQKAKSLNLHSKGLLIADAGTILSLTLITANGEFAGGQLVPGLQMQRSAMSNGTQDLKPVSRNDIPQTKFPASTEEAMLRGSFQSMFGTLLEAQKEIGAPIWLCGGDSAIFFPYLRDREVDVYHYPDLVLEGMVKINASLKKEPNLRQSDQP